MRRLIVSDTHIGSAHYKGELLKQFLLEKYDDYDELIFAGDIIDFIRVPTFSAQDIEIFESINFEKRVIYIPGNHDHSFLGFVNKKVFGFEFLKKYEFEEGGKKFRIGHGDQYDKPYVSVKLFMNFVSVIQSCIEYWFGINLFEIFNFWKKHRKRLKRVWDVLQDNLDVDVLICGHFHQPESVIWIDKDEQIKTYINSGDWVSHSTYVSIIDGVVRLKNYSGTDNC